MITKNMETAINEQINKEFSSSYLYLSMAAWFDGTGLKGAASWLHAQAEEEREHAMKLVEHLADRGGTLELKSIPQPKATWEGPMEAFKEVLSHEQFITKSIHDLYNTAVKEADLPAQIMLQWFIAEQVEEEKNAADIISSMTRIQNHETAVLQLDHQLGKRGRS